MTPFEFLVPVVGFIVAACGTWFLRREAHRLDSRVPVRAERQK